MKRDTWNISLANQDAIEWFVAEVDKEWDIILAKETASELRPKHICMSPMDHYHIAESNRLRCDLTELLTSLGDNPAIIVCPIESRL